jgi:hypothetical protein
VVIICEPYTSGFHVYPRDRTAYAKMYDPPSPFIAQLSQRHYRTIDLYEWDDVEWNSFGIWLCMSASIRLLPFGGRYKAGLQPEILGGFFLCVIYFLSFISTYLCSIYTLSTVLSSLYSLFFTIFLLPSFFCILLSIVLYLLSTVYVWLPILSYSSSNIHSLTLNGCHMLLAIRSSLFSTASSP